MAGSCSCPRQAAGSTGVRLAFPSLSIRRSRQSRLGTHRSNYNFLASKLAPSTLLLTRSRKLFEIGAFRSPPDPPRPRPRYRDTSIDNRAPSQIRPQTTVYFPMPSVYWRATTLALACRWHCPPVTQTIISFGLPPRFGSPRAPLPVEVPPAETIW